MRREHKPYTPRNRKFEISEKNIRLRWILVCALLVIAVAAIIWGIFGSRQKPGWYTVESTSTGLHCGHDFLLNYEYGAGDKKPHVEKKELSKLYTALTEEAFQLFYSEAGESQLGNLYHINAHPNEEVTVDPALYAALQLMERQNSRLHYLGPVYTVYDQLFLNTEEVFAAEFDPGQNEEIRQDVLKMAQFAADPGAIQLEMRQDNRVLLHVSQEYMTFLKEYGKENCYIDFGWLRNAFIIDYLAEKLAENGFTNCNITSVDGFARNLDQRGSGYQLSLFNRRDEKTELAATMGYSKATSVVYLRTYDSSRVYPFPDGRVVTYFIDIADGQSKTALPNLLSYSETAGCAETALQIAPYFITQNFSAEHVNDLADQGIYSIWFEDKTLRYNQPGLQLTPKSDAYILSQAH